MLGLGSLKVSSDSQGSLDTFDQSHKARLNGRAEQFRKLRCKTVCALRMEKEANVSGVCEGVEHQLCQVILVLLPGEFAHCVPPRHCVPLVNCSWNGGWLALDRGVRSEGLLGRLLLAAVPR